MLGAMLYSVSNRYILRKTLYHCVSNPKECERAVSTNMSSQGLAKVRFAPIEHFPKGAVLE